MVKRFSLLFSLILILLFLGSMKTAFGDASAELEQAIRATSTGDLEQAEAIYKSVAAREAGGDAGLEAREKLACLYVKRGRNADAQGQLDAMRSEYGDNGLLAGAVTRVGDAYRLSSGHVKACEVYDYVISTWPGSEFALWSQMDLAVCKTAMKDGAGAEAAFERLLADYSGNGLLPKAVCVLGDNYRQIGQAGQAVEVYVRALENWPDADHAIWSEMGLAVANIRLKRLEAAKDGVGRLVRGFSDRAEAASALCQVGDEYRKMGKYTEACELYGHIVAEHRDSDHAFWARMNTALSKIALKDDAGAEEAVERVYDYEDSGDERVPFALRTIADGYRGAQKFDDACEIYEYVVENHAATKEALWSQMNLAMTLIRIEDPNADSAADKLLADYSRDSEASSAICWVADEYRRCNKDDEASELYMRVLKDYPDSEHALWSQTGLAVSSLKLGDDPKAQDALAYLLLNYGKENGFGKAISSIAGQYYRDKDFAKWREVYQTLLDVVDSLPEGRGGIWAGVAESAANVHLGDEDKAKSAIDKLEADFADHPDLALALWRIGTEYYHNGSRLQGEGLKEEGNAQVKMMVVLGERLRERVPAIDDSVEAWLFSGVASSHVGEYFAAVEYFKEVVKRWPGHRFAPAAQYRVGSTHTLMKVPDYISRKDRRVGAKAGYDKLVADYPDSRYADIARRWLDRNAAYFREGGEK